MYYIYFINEIINKIKLSNFSKKQSKCYKCSHVGVHFIIFSMKNSADSCVGIGCKEKRAFQR